ncbi:MAG: type VI secretion system tip protein VgrG, partial [Desulfovibrio sp.]|nr:type VI secretion system tip protein VgrG [Desulfovibrio sp.]
MRPDADTSWFTFTAQSGPPGGFAVYEFSGMEGVCKPYEFQIELVSRSANVDITALLGTPACLSIADRSGGTRLVHGLISQMQQLHTANAFTHYQCVLVPRLWFLGQITDHRIFQNLSVVEIIQRILREQGFKDEEIFFELFYTYKAREYCVQYGETVLHFITRLCEEEGIYFYFEHTENLHCLHLRDYKGGSNIAGEWDIRFFPGSGQVADTAVISRLDLYHGVKSNASMYKEWNFQTPKLDITAKEREPDIQKAPVPPGMLLEQYQYPHLYDERDRGNRYARLQLDRQLTFSKWIECESDVTRFLPGYTFSLHSHPRDDANRDWWIVSVEHRGEQPEVLEHESPDDRGLYYKAKVKALPDDTRFVPETKHKKVRIDGLQSAIVTGPANEEVYCDEYGRVKVQFHWDRLGQHDETTTCWVRVADTWAGTNFGFIQVPRIGQEVMVEFMEGDPDRPVITGRVYNAALRPPWQLPQQKTLSGIQSREFKAGRRNQLVLDDMQNQIQAQLSSDHNLSQLNLGYITRI